ncbi:hypothetical protein HDU87_005243 [Geranomyces variabilis]|uniref:PH domain-containing protein n=1 Tax=Geranomyces variabilis TaxID=109894 RepID=A0AAD5THQ6_9FUNG|nr:hypothetical protein HDU87_005243 [Geranomyces variabilis]
MDARTTRSHEDHQHQSPPPVAGTIRRSSLMRKQQDPLSVHSLPAGSPSRTSSLRSAARQTAGGRQQQQDVSRPQHDAHFQTPPLPPPSPHRPVHYALPTPSHSRLSQQFSDNNARPADRSSPSLSVQSEHSSFGGLLGADGQKRATVVHAGARLSALGSPSPALSDRASVLSSAVGPGRAPTPRFSTQLSELNFPIASSPLPPSSLPPPRRKNSELAAVAPVPVVDLYQISPEANAWRAQPSPENVHIAASAYSETASDAKDESPAISRIPGQDQGQYWEMEDAAQKSADGKHIQGFGDRDDTAAAQDYEDSFDAMQYHLYEGTGTPSGLPAGRRGPNQPSPPVSRASSPHAIASTPVNNTRPAPAEPTFRMKNTEFPHNPTPPRDHEDRRPMHEPPRSVASFASKEPRPYFQTTIFSGHLMKQSRHSSFQKRLFRCDGILLVCLSSREVPLPRNADLSKIRTETYYDEKDDFLDYVRRYYPALPVFPNTLIAEGDAEGIPQEDGRNYCAPKWIIPTSSILSVRSLIQHPAPMPNAKKARTFIIRTRGRDYTLCAPTPEEFRKWTFLLSRLCLENENRRESSSFEEEDYPRGRSETSSDDGLDSFDRSARFLEKSEAWRRCVRELMSKDPTTHRALTNVGGSIIIPNNNRDSTTPPDSRRGSVYEQVPSSPIAPPRRSSAYVEPRNYGDPVQAQRSTIVDPRNQMGAAQPAASNTAQNSRPAGPASPRPAFYDDSRSEPTVAEGYETPSRTSHRRSSSGHADAGPTLTEIERELSVLRRVPVAEFVSGAAYPPVPVPAAPASVSSRNSASYAKTAVLEDTLATDLSSILRIIAHLRGEFLRTPEDRDSNAPGRNTEAPRYAEPRFIRHFVTHSIPTLLARVGVALPRHPTCRDVTDDWLQLEDEWDPERIGLRGQDVIVKDLEQLVGHIIVCLR